MTTQRNRRDMTLAGIETKERQAMLDPGYWDNKEALLPRRELAEMIFGKSTVELAIRGGQRLRRHFGKTALNRGGLDTPGVLE